MGNIFHGMLEVIGCHIFILMEINIVSHPLPEQIITQHEAQHVEDTGTPRINSAIKYVFGVSIVIGYRRASVNTGICFNEGVLGFKHVPLELILSFAAFIVKGLEVCRKAFIQPGMRPVAAGEQVAEPLMYKLVCDKPVAGNIEMRTFAVNRFVGKG
jgi:hypothetical protein